MQIQVHICKFKCTIMKWNGKWGWWCKYLQNASIVAMAGTLAIRWCISIQYCGWSNFGPTTTQTIGITPSTILFTTRPTTKDHFLNFSSNSLSFTHTDLKMEWSYHLILKQVEADLVPLDPDQGRRVKLVSTGGGGSGGFSFIWLRKLLFSREDAITNPPPTSSHHKQADQLKGVFTYFTFTSQTQTDTGGGGWVKKQPAGNVDYVIGSRAKTHRWWRNEENKR